MNPWKFCFTTEIIDLIVLSTNVYINDKRPNIKKLTTKELEIYIGSLFLIGILKNNLKVKAVFYNLLNAPAYDAYVLYWNKKRICCSSWEKFKKKIPKIPVKNLLDLLIIQKDLCIVKKFLNLQIVIFAKYVRKENRRDVIKLLRIQRIFLWRLSSKN